MLYYSGIKRAVLCGTDIWHHHGLLRALDACIVLIFICDSQMSLAIDAGILN